VTLFPVQWKQNACRMLILYMREFYNEGCVLAYVLLLGHFKKY